MNSKWHNLLWGLAILLCSATCNKPVAFIPSVEPTVELATTSQSTPAITATASLEFSGSDAPIAIVSLEDQTLKFDCVGNTRCLPDTSLAGHILLDAPFELGNVMYWSPSSIYLYLYSPHSVPWKKNYFHINPQSGEIRSTRLPKDLDDSLHQVVGNRLVIAEYGEKSLYILKDDLSISSVEIGFPIRKLIGTSDWQVVALNTDPVEQGGIAVIDVSMIDVITGDAKRKNFPLPGLELNRAYTTPQVGQKYLVSIEGISRDIKNLYCLYYSGDNPQIIRLGTFDIETSQEIASTEDRELVHFTYGYAQYHDILYSINVGSNEFSTKASLIDMSTVTSLLDFSPNPDWQQKLIIYPFGENFVLGSKTQLILMSPAGEILQRYPIPQKWLARDYQLMYFTR